MNVPSLEGITRIEAMGGQRGGLGRAFELLDLRWKAGCRDDETALRRLFLAWYAFAEPPYLTGLPTDIPGASIFEEAAAHFGGETSDNGEYLFVAGYLATIFAPGMGNEHGLAAFGERCLARARALGWVPNADHFAGRGEMGRYFEHIARSGWFEAFAPRS